MKMTERIGPNLSGINHQGRRYTPKELVRKGLPSFNSGNVPLTNADIANMVQEFRADKGCEPTILHHSGLGTAGKSQLVQMPDGRNIWLRLEIDAQGNWLE